MAVLSVMILAGAGYAAWHCLREEESAPAPVTVESPVQHFSIATPAATPRCPPSEASATATVLTTRAVPAPADCKASEPVPRPPDVPMEATASTEDSGVPAWLQEVMNPSRSAGQVPRQPGVAPRNATQDEEPSPSRGVPSPSSGGEGGRGFTSRESLRDTVLYIAEIDWTPVMLMNSGEAAFSRLRRSCLHARDLPRVLEFEAKSAPAVFGFLVSFAKRYYRFRGEQIREVLDILQGSSAWTAAWNATPTLTQRVNSELPEEARCMFPEEDIPTVFGEQG
mmetsp:Transcript_62161/g.140224  ORF Transcript_62161/g.140224 Transcript_62161/m.140224 type:complete len:281 (-) Transcript_62161:83-925(-)